MNWFGRVLIFGYAVLSLGWAIFSQDPWPIRLLLFVLAVLYIVAGTRAEILARREDAYTE